MSENFIVELLKYCVLLPILLAVGWFSLMQHRALREVESKRADDVKSVNSQLILLSEKWVGAIEKLVSTTNAQLEGIKELKETINDLRNDLRR